MKFSSNITIISFSLIIILTSCNKTNTEKRVQISPVSIKLKNRVDCLLEYMSEAIYENSVIKMTGPRKQRIADKFNISFHNLNSSTPLINSKWGEIEFKSSGTKIIDDDSKIIIIEFENPKRFIDMPVFYSHTLFKKTGVYLYTKSNALAGEIPRGTMSMGYCY